MKPENKTAEAPKPEPVSESQPIQQPAKPELVVLTTDDDAVGVCNLAGECA